MRVRLPTVDLLAIAAHPDDVELNVAGTLLSVADRGGTFAICDLTRGERGSRGSADLRARETAQANQVLGLPPERRINLGLPDGGIAVESEQIESVVRMIRSIRPRVLLMPWRYDRHPDHEATHQLVRRAVFDAGLTSIATRGEDGSEQPPFRPSRLYAYYQAFEERPEIVVDISDQFERKLEAIAAYSSQFTLPGRESSDPEKGPETYVSQTAFMEFIIARMKHWGFMVGAKYGEPFTTIGVPFGVRDPMML